MLPVVRRPNDITGGHGRIEVEPYIAEGRRLLGELLCTVFPIEQDVASRGK